MAGVSKLKVGVDVPWVTSWSGEKLLGVAPCASVEGRLAIGQAERPGVGKPQYSMNHMRRQRETVLGMLCPMCGAPTRENDRWSQTGRRVAAGVLRQRGYASVLPAALPDSRVLLNAGSIAPLHQACAERALTYCPHLRGDPDPEIKPFPKTFVSFPLMVETRPEAPAGHALLSRPAAAPAPVLVIGFVQLVGVTDVDDPDWRRALA